MLFVKKVFIGIILVNLFSSCNDDSKDVTIIFEENDTNSVVDCVVDYVLDSYRGVCDETLSVLPEYSEVVSNKERLINTNAIPNHKVGLFGSKIDALNPNEISAQSQSYTITTSPVEAEQLTPLLSDTGIDFSFGVLFNGIELDPIAAEPFPHEGIMSDNVNWEWNLEATNVNLGLDCNNAHVQPSGKYHYHGSPTLYLEALEMENNQMTMIGYAADGFPIYYKYAYTIADDANSDIVEMTSSYQLKSGDRPGDGITAPCGSYDGVYSADYEYIDELGTLDQANGRVGVTPEYPDGIYYYIITEYFPIIPRYFKGTPSTSFTI